jgi:hypothetical protein
VTGEGRLWLLTAALLALALVGCGPDCDKYCNKVAQCAQEETPPRTVDVAQCVVGCNESGSSKTATIQCYIDHTCTDIAVGGHCSPTGVPPKAP